MSIYETVKAAISVKDAAEQYGLKVNRNGMICCPFHNDRHPSLKLNEDYFYCFGCGATGDVIDFTARLFGLSSYEAAQKLIANFGLDPDKPPAAAALRRPKYPLVRAFRQDELYCRRVLNDYLRLLEDWRVRYSPHSPENFRAPAGTQRSGSGGERTSSGMDEPCRLRRGEGYGACEDEDDRFVESCQMLDYVEHLADILAVGELEHRVKAVQMLLSDGTITRLEEGLDRLKKEARQNERNDDFSL